MASKGHFKLIIVGGGVLGLTLANMLEKFDIDYVLLEAHGDIAPSVGASIGLMPNGLLIVDQLGRYEAVKAAAHDGAIKDSHTRSPTGKSMSYTKDLLGHMEKRHGYPILFFDRQWFLEVLYDGIKYKERILLNNRVDKIEQLPNGVRVTTTQGDVHFGDIVVGGDGIHSTVRREMRRLADGTRPGYMSPGEEERVPCYYQCSFGIARNVDGWIDGDLSNTSGDGHSFIIAPGPEKRCYWFMFKRLPKVKFGKDIPRYSKEDEAAFVQKYAHIKVTETVTFGHLYAKRLSSSFTPLHEAVYEKWFFERIILMGDSAHKPNPITGQGGNGAIETAAEFVNALISTRDSRPNGLVGLTANEIEAISQTIQAKRHERAKNIVAIAHKVQAFFAFENPLLSRFIFSVAMPLSSDENSFERLGTSFIDTSRLEHLPVPHRLRAIPFTYELPAQPFEQASTMGMRGVLVAGMGLTLWASTKALRIPLDELSDWSELGRINKIWLGNTGMTDFLARIMSAASCSLTGNSAGERVSVVYLLSQLISPLLIYTIEGYRIGNQGTLLAFPSLFTVGMQFQGIGRIAPLYAIINAFQSFHRPPGRYVRPEVAKVLVPALTVGYVLPTIMMFLPTTNTENWQYWTRLWQFAPAIFSVCTTMFSSALRWWQRRKLSLETAAEKKISEEESKEVENPQDEKDHFDRYRQGDVPILKSVYEYAFAVQATAHIATMVYSYFHPDISFTKTFFSLPNPFNRDWSLFTVPQQLAAGFKYDLTFAAVGYITHGLYSIWDLRRLGYVTTKDAAKASAAIVIGQIGFGPGATWAGLWSWRESAISRLSTTTNVP